MIELNKELLDTRILKATVAMEKAANETTNVDTFAALTTGFESLKELVEITNAQVSEESK